VFRLYRDVDGWSAWDPDVRPSSVEGGLQRGASGTLTPTRGPRASITVTDVQEDVSFTVESRLPLCTMRFEHELRPRGHMTHVVHRVTFMGPLAFLFGRVIGTQIRKGLTRTLQGLKAASER
jgi:hypothetical protein